MVHMHSAAYETSLCGQSLEMRVQISMQLQHLLDKPVMTTHRLTVTFEGVRVSLVAVASLCVQHKMVR
jgi:hypothetical protein